MASRRQKQFERKYSSYRKYTATEDVNYSTHSSRSSYRSESLTSRADGRGRSSSTEIVSGSETRSYPVYIAIQDYTPEPTEIESIALEQGQIVEVLDKKNSARWLVRTKARPPQSGWVPGSYFETPTEYYKQRRRTREIQGKDNMTEEQEATLKRDQVYHDLLNSEEEFVANLRSCVDFYITALDSPDLPAEILEIREQLALNVSELYNFHANILLKGLNYYSDDPGKVGQTFVRLERDFEQHVHFFRELPQTLKLLEEPKIRDFFEARANTCEAGASSYPQRLQQVADRMTEYQNFFKEFVKYASRAQQSTRSVQKALELVQSIPQRINELQFTKNIKDYPGDTSRLGRLIRHDPFKVDDGEGPKDRYVFMFKNKLMVTEKSGTDPLDKYAVRTHTSDADVLVLKPTDPGLPAFTMTPSNIEESEFVRKGWLRDIAEEHEAYAAIRAETETTTATEGFDSLTASDMRSEFSEYTGTSSRKSSLPFGPEEGGTPRKKIKSPPVISPTGSTTSLYSGGSSSIDWTTTGTTLEMQGTRVTRTQYGFRTLQESSAKMCLKVTGYPLPEITWYKDDVQLHEDERHTFYADEDGFFAMTIDPVQVEDTGRYTCMATNEYGQASTSAFFRVLKVEKEAAPPKFVNSLRDQECKEGEVCSFECEVEGWPEPELLWLVDDQPLRPSHDFRLQYDGQKATLEIRDAQPDDTGVYTVKIQNEFGTAESKAELLVQPDPDKNHVGPEFQAVIEDVECKEGDEVRFKAVYTGDPTPEITWLINGYPLSESEKIRFINEDGICILTIKDVTRHFDGIVTCQANNRLGSEQCTARLKVIVPPAPPTFNKQLEDKTVLEKNQAAFEVDVSGWPEPKVAFILKGKELKHGENGVEISGADGYFRVVIPNCQQDIHEGEIIARASNEHGTAESRARLTVEIPEEESRSAPTFLKDIEDQTVKHGQLAVFETTVSGSPNPDVTWYINGHKMDESSPGIKIEVINHDHKLTIDSAQYAGTVLCRAENVVGRFETKARLVVLPQEKPKKAPRFLEGLKDITETEQNTVVFEVRVEGEPIPTVKWFLNGKELTTSDSRVEIREFDGSIKLELKNISLADAGEIKAVATNSEGTAETSSKLTVKRKPFPPAFDKGPQSITVEKGEWAEFTAHADGEPAPEYQWSVDGRKIRETTEGAQVRVENGTAILRLNTAIFSSSCTISVTAENSLGVDETGARLTVSDEAERRRKEEEERKKKEEEEAKRKAEEEARRKAEEEEARKRAEEEAKRKAEEEEAARKKAEEEEASRKKAEEEEAARRKAAEEEEARRKAAEEEARRKAEEEIAKPVVSAVEETTRTTVEARADSDAPSKEILIDIETKEERPPAESVLAVSETTTTTTITESRGGQEVVTEVEQRPIEVRGGEISEEVTTEVKTTTTKTETTTTMEPSVSSELTVESKTTTTTTTTTSEIKVEGPVTVEISSEKRVEKTEISTGLPVETTEITSETKTTVTESSGITVEPSQSEQKPVDTTVAQEEIKTEVSTKTEVTTEAQVAEQKPVESKEVPEKGPSEKTAAEEKIEPKTEGTIEISKIEKVEPTDKVPTITITEPNVEEDKPKAEQTAAKDKAAPKVTRELKTQTVSRGDLAHFEAVIEHATTVRWYHQGKEVTSSTHGVKISHDENFEFRLSLDSSVFSEGDVSIVGENTLGSASSKAEMKITEQMKEFKKPEFTDKLKDIEIFKGESFQMDVIALNSPQYKWYLNGKELKHGVDGVQIVEEGNKSSLRIEKALPEHQGAQVQVTATNEVGTSECSAKLTLKERATAPVIKDGPQDAKTKEGEPAEFKVKITGYPEPTVQWYINEKIVEQSSTTIISHSGEDYALRITETKITESGTVAVSATNSAGSDRKESKLTVEKGIAAPVFHAKLEEKTVNEGEQATWNVKVDNPTPGTSLKWYINGKELSPKDGVEITDDGNGNHKLTVKASPDMDGTLTVKATNEAGSAEDSAKVTVKSSQKKPEFTKLPQNHETTIDESVKFSAVVEGIPTPQISWFLNGKKLEDGPDAHVKHEADTGKTSIRIHKPKLEDSGQIKVVAENNLGKAEATADLKVDRKTEVPKFTTNMDDRQVNEGTTVKYTSTVEGYPVPTVEWTLNGEPVSKYPNIKVSDDGVNHTIEINEITKQQEGELSCQATNSVGFKKQNVQLAVKIVGEAPTFAKNLQDLLVTEGELTLMEAKLNVVKPKPKVTWLKDGKEFTSDDHWKLEEKEDGTLILKIVTTEMTDKCRITIKAENHFGQAECAASLGVIKKVPMAKPAFQSDIAPINIAEGDSLQTKLLITGNPTPFVKWYINGQLVCETEDTEITNANGVYSLTIHGCTADMTGKIKCTAYNKAGEVSTEGTLKVTKPIPVEFETSLCDATCREGDTLKLKAVLLGEPTPVVSWYVNGKKLEETQNIKIHAEKGTYTVTIKDITCDYSGKVVCEAVNEYGKASSEAMLLVLPRGEPPDFLEWLSNVRARQGSKVVHKVVFTGDPKPTLTWYIRNQEVVSGKDITIVTDDKTSVLTINNFNPDIHVGEIICKAENEAGEVSCTANMTTYTSDMFSESDSDAQLEDYGVNDAQNTDEDSLREDTKTPVRTPTPVMAPKFITKIKDAKAKKGHEAIFECVVPDTKGVVCKWLKDGKEIELIARIRVQSRNVEGANQVAHELIIEDVRPEDVGRYTCIVENSAGKDVCEANLTIIETLEKPADKAPEFTTKLQDKKVETSEKVVFECKVAGEPKPSVSWYHETIKIEESSNIKIETIEEVQRLTINSAKVEDKGKYSCVAENTAGTSKTEATLEVTAHAPEFTKRLEERNLSIGEKLVLSCSVKGQPQPHVEFYRGETRLTSSDRIAVEHDKTNTHWRIVIKETTKEELNIIYKAVATNTAGTATSEAKISSKDLPPVFEQGLKSTSVKEKEEIRMEVKVSGTQPDVQFLKDGQPVKEDSNHEVKKDEDTGKFTLIIKESALADAGKYTAKATNPAGSAESTAEAEVTKALEAPIFVKELVSVEIKEKTSTTLSATVKGVPEPEVQWQKDGSPVTVDGTHLISQKGSAGEHSLVVKEARKEDAGRYTCTAVNPAGSATTSCDLKIAKSSEAPRFTEELRSLEVKETQTLTLSVTVVGEPAPTVAWKKDNSPVNIDGSHVIVKDEGNGHFVLTIKDARKSDVGSYSCVATNEAGVATTSCELKLAKVLEGPHFTEELRNMEVKETETLTLSVTVVGEPAPKVEWKKDNSPVNIDGSHVTVKDEGNGHFTLTVKDARKSDVGHYTAVAKNEVGTATTECDLKLARVNEAPRFTEELRPLEVRENETLSLSVTVVGEPAPQVEWKKDNTPVSIDESHIIAKDEGNGHFVLTIKDARVGDVGSYSCVATNVAGKATTEAKMGVIEEVSAPHFVEGLKPLETEEGKPAELSVTVEGKPEPEVVFMKDGVPVQADAQHEIKKDSQGHHVLVIKSVTQRDEGKYSCVAQNKAGKEETIGDLKIPRYSFEKTKEEEVAPLFIEPLKEATATVGDTVTLECRVNAESKPEIKWFQNDKPITLGPHLETTMTEDGIVRLVIHGATADDIGAYRCEAVNRVGTAKTTAELKYAKESAVHVAEEITEEIAEIKTEDLKEKASAVSGRGPPEFIELLRSCTVTISETAVLKCRVKGEPRPKIKWTKDGKEIEMSTRIRTEYKEDGYISLTIEKTEQKDAGEYKCHAENEHGSAWTEGPIVLTQVGAAPTEGDAPDFIQPVRPVVVEEGETAVLEGKISGKPTPTVKWYKNGEQLKESDRVKIESLPDGTQRLTVKDSTLADTDEYRCEASNVYGDVWSDVTLTVKEKHMDAPEFLKELRAVAVVEGKKAEFECRVKCIPKGEVKWFKDGEEIPTDARVHKESDSDGTEKLIIETSKIEDQGNYRVEVTNPAGQTSSKAPLTVTPAETLKIKKELEDQKIVKGTKILLSVEVEGKPKTVKWYRNDQQVTASTTTKLEQVTESVYRLEISSGQPTDAGSYRVVLSTESVSVESSCTVTVSEGVPVFKKGLSDQKVPKGTPLVLEVEVEGKPKNVKWYKGDNEIPGEDLGNGKYRLTVPNFDDKDVGQYKVVAENDDGKADSSAKADLVDDGKDKVKPEIVSGLVPTTVSQGETATFTVKVKGPVKGVKWYKNGKEIPNPKTSSPADGTYVLEVPNAQKDDTADYKVVLSNDAGDADSSAALTVKLPRLEITKGLEDQTVEKGKKATLEVKTNGKPKQIKWYKNGKEIAPGDKAKPESDGNTHKLVIPDTDDVDAADYKVVLTGDDDTLADSSCALTVKLPAEEPRFVKGLEDQTVPVGSPLNLEIKTTGSPKTVKWYKNGKEVAATAGKINIKKIDDNNYVLEIPKSAVDDTGDYKVEIENEAGKATSQGKVTVEPQLTFIKPLKDQEVVEGENAEFKVETNAKPRTVKWYKNGQEIKPDAHFVMAGDDKTYTLTIKGATKDDAAEFKVVLSNSAGDADSSAKLTVKKAKPGAPKIVKGLDDQVVAKGAALVFEVKVEGDVDEVRWLKDATPITAGANAVIEKVDNQTYRLTIPKADLGDAGHYSVELSNEGGKAKSDAKGEVDEKPEIVKGLEDTEVQEGDDDVLKVEVSAPVRTVKWYKNGQEIKPSGHLEPKKIGPKKYELAINKAQLDDGATYKVVLSNAAGECDSSAALTVTKPNILKILDGLKDVDVTEGEPLNLKVKVQGIPKTVKWYKNGQELAPSDKLKLKESPETGEFSLEIPSSEKSDGAAYRVVLSNEKGEVYSGCVAHVKAAKPSTQDVAANFLTPLQDTEVEEGETLTLTCKVGGEPFPEIKWEKDGITLEKSDRISMRTALDGTVTLRIRDAKKSDLGQYRVTATNPTGSATSACAVHVKDKGEEPTKPHFIIPLSSCSAAIGTKKEFQVKVRGFPKPELKWTLNGKPIVPDDRFVVEDIGAGNYSLTIKDIREEDYGTLRCTATNNLGSDETSCEFEKTTDRTPRDLSDDRYPPRFNVPLWDRRIPIHDLMTIECHVDAKPTAEITWFKDGQPLQTSDRVEIRNSSDGACRVRIDRFDDGDCGVYKCVAKNELGVADTQSTYSVEILEQVEEVKKKEFAPKFNPGLEDRSVNAGQPLRLSCHVTAEPRAAVTWYKDGLPLRADGRITLEYDTDGNCSLNIAQAKESDEGAYRCVATNEHGSINTSCLVTVKVPKTEIKKEGEEPFFTKNLVDVWTDRGDTFTMTCSVKGDPFPEIKWYRNGQLVRNSPRTIIETSPDGVCSITVKECTMSDEGIFRCEAENKHGKAKTQATAHVQMALGKSDKPKLEEGSPPRFIIPLSDQTITLGSIIDLECKVTGQPMPHVKWSKDGGPIWEDARYEWDIDEAKGVYHLRIKNSTVADEGTYRCVATNDSGSATTKAFIRIDDGAGAAPLGGKTAPPRFAIKLGDARATEGQPLKLECKVEGFPLPSLTWHKDGAQILPSDRIQISLGPDGIARLVIPQCRMDDEGIYRVIATNPSGSAHDKGNAVVKKLTRESPRRSAERDLYDSNKAPRLLEPLENVKVPEKEGFRLRCKWSGDPKPTIKWFKDGERVFPYGRLKLVEHDDGVCELIVDSSARQDAGGYRCVAENSYGSARTTCDVIVVPKERKPRDIGAALATGKAPGFTIPLTIRRAKPGESVTFECLPYGTPFPTIKWLKDGIELIADNNYSMESLPDGTQKLTVKNITFLSEGYFRCVATNEHGTASTKAELVVEGDRSLGARKPVDLTPKEPEESKPRIRRGLYNMSIHQGNVVEMIVCATGWPTPTVKWYKDGEEIVSDGPDGKRVHFTDERGIHHLVILNVGPEDEGEYSLEATNKLGSARTEGALNIIRPRTVGGFDGENDRGGLPFPPGFVRQLKNKHVFHHMPTIFDCLVVGHPAPEVEWFHNGKKIIPGGRIKIQSCGGGSHAIIILDTTVDDAGEYVAVAKNCHGTASSSAILDVTVPHLDNIKFNGEIDVTPYLTEEYGFKKINVASLPTPPDRGPFIKEVTGHYLTLSWIPTKRAPPRYPQVTYVIEIRELPEKEWTLLDYNIPEPVCKVRNLELGKSYQFRVRAENIYGISDPSPASPPSRLMAPPQPVLDKRTKKVIPLLDPYAERALDLAHAEQYACAPWFAPGVVEKRYCAENDTLTIILNVSGYPDPQIQWKFRGWDVDTTSPTSKCKVYTYGGTETTLTITGFTKENVGQYQCIATNPYGEAQQNVMVDLATRPSFIQPLINKTFSSAHPMRLDVRVEGEPFPELKWMKEWRPIVESSRVKFVQDGPYLCSLIINDPMWRDSGIYSCVAINDAGQATTSCTVTVEADGDYNDVELPKKRVTMDARKVREIYEIEEEDEKQAAGGAPFRVKEKKTGKQFLAQLKPYEEAKKGLEIHNALEHENAAQYRQVFHDGDLAVVVYEDVTGTILENLLHPGVAVAEPTGLDREKMVQVFIRQLLNALEQMHSLRIAHLDLRPETILMQDGKLKLADFGQARRLLRGLITGTIRSNPEFVSPEVVRGYPLTLATDLWSVGTLAYVLLTGVSPFHGDNDNETLANVDKAKVSFDGPEWSSFSDDAKSFVSQLLNEIPAERLTCEEALKHRWLDDEKVKNAQLPADGLREFNYKHKWLERRVFVQQSPSEQILEAILAPSTTIVKPQPKPPAEGAGTLELYDYLRIKPRSPAPVEDVPRGKRRAPGPVVPEGFADFPPEYLPPGALPPPPEYHPRDPRRRPDLSPDRFGNPPPHHQGFDPRQSPSQKEKIPLDQFGRLIRPEDLARIPHDSFGRPLDLDQNFPREEPRGSLGPIQQIPPFKGERSDKSPQRPPPPDYSMTEKRKLIPQEKGETPSKTRREPRKEAEPGMDGGNQVQVPLRMIRGERRQIEEEIANRILSDISEEGSVAGSLASIDDLEPMLYEAGRHRHHSPSVTPHAEDDVSTPTASPVNTIKEGNFFALIDNDSLDNLPRHEKDLLERAENDPNIPVGAPLFLEGLTNTTLTVDTAPLPSPKSPKSPRRSTPGTKSPVLLSPGREHTMEALIAMKRGKPQFLAPGERAPEIDDEDAHMDKRKQQVKPTKHDSNFKDLQDELEKKRKTDLDDLEKYRPRNFYKEDIDFERPGYDIDASPWDSHYQIGPDTYLMASQGPSFNSRVRDYRRQLWGDGAPLVRQGILGYRNQDITVRERRRYTDILRETNNGLQPKQTDGSVMRTPSSSAVDRIKADIQNVAPSATRKNADGTYAPIFISRLKDAYLGHASAVFEVAVAASPAPKMQWHFQGKPIESDDRRTIEQVGSVSRLTIQQPTPYDLGEYSCAATNEFGTDKTTSRLVSGEAPSRPGRPECELSSDTELFITWQPPEGPTYLEGITYRLEYRPSGPNELSAPWIVISEHIDDEAVVVKHLEPQGVYQFRVTARNGVGLGVPSLSSRMVQTHGRGVPKLQVDILKDHYRLNQVTLPQKSATQLNEISEESESEIGDSPQAQENVELSNKDPSDRFQIDALLCRGKFSVLRAAVDGKTEGSSQCVVKIRDSRDSDAGREFKLLKESQHENVQKLVAAHDCGGFLYLFCERLYEDVFSRFSFSDYYTEEQVAMTVRQLTSAIHWLHFRGIAHLDINPYNVMFQTKRNWIVKLVDFHSAQELSSAVKPGEPNVLWAAPEMHVPEVPVTVQSDVWGMAIITFCLLGGFHPFYSEYDQKDEIKENVLNVKCDPNLIPVTASQEALSFVTWGLKKSPIRRMRTDEALSHKFLSADPSMVRRREAARYSASRLRKTTHLTLPEPARPISNELHNKYGEKNIQ